MNRGGRGASLPSNVRIVREEYDTTAYSAACGARAP